MKTSARTIIWLVTIGWLPWLSGLSAAELELSAVTKRAEDRVEFWIQDGAAVATVRSPAGIGSATISRTAGDWPARFTLRLHLHGLESFKLSNGRRELEAEAAGPERRRFLQVAESSPSTEEPLGQQKLADYEVRSFDKDGRPTNQLPLADGYFEVRIPRELLSSDSRSITIHWIDFYR